MGTGEQLLSLKKRIILSSSCLADEWHTCRKAGLEFGEPTKGDGVRSSFAVTRTVFFLL